MDEQAIDDQDNEQRLQRERSAFFDWLERTPSRNADYNRELGEEDVLVMIEEACDEVA